MAGPVPTLATSRCRWIWSDGGRLLRKILDFRIQAMRSSWPWTHMRIHAHELTYDVTTCAVHAHEDRDCAYHAHSSHAFHACTDVKKRSSISHLVAPRAPLSLHVHVHTLMLLRVTSCPSVIFLSLVSQLISSLRLLPVLFPWRRDGTKGSKSRQEDR